MNCIDEDKLLYLFFSKIVLIQNYFQALGKCDQKRLILADIPAVERVLSSHPISLSDYNMVSMTFYLCRKK